MQNLVRRLVIAVTLVAVFAPAALAGGANAKVEGPAEDGRYTVRTYACSDPAGSAARSSTVHGSSVSPVTAKCRASGSSSKGNAVLSMLEQYFGNVGVTAWAEGLVDGKRQTVPIKIELTRTKGVYQFKRTWPEGGQWAIRMALRNQGPHAPVTVTALAPNGAVKVNKLIWEGDGQNECVAILNGKGC